MRIPRTALWALLGCDSVLLVACSKTEQSDPAQSTRSAPVASDVQKLNLSPTLRDFVLYATNSILIGSKAIVSGGDVGVVARGTGALLTTGYELAVAEKAEVSLGRNLIADSILLGSEARSGDIQTSELVDRGAVHGAVSTFLTLPPLPIAAAIQPGMVDRTLPANSTLALPAGRYRKVAVGSKATLRLEGGTYELAELTLGEKARVEVISYFRLVVIVWYKVCC
jgi:hypothetical protein